MICNTKIFNNSSLVCDVMPGELTNGYRIPYTVNNLGRKILPALREQILQDEPIQRSEPTLVGGNSNPMFYEWEMYKVDNSVVMVEMRRHRKDDWGGTAKPPLILELKISLHPPTTYLTQGIESALGDCGATFEKSYSPTSQP